MISPAGWICCARTPLMPNISATANVQRRHAILVIEVLV
jgi:hypothetical protein